MRAGTGAFHAPRDRCELEEEAHQCLRRMFRSALTALFVVAGPEQSVQRLEWDG